MMDTITLEPPTESGVHPGDTIEITARWSLETTPSRLEARMFWYTLGKGTQDLQVVETIALPNAPSGKQRLRFRVPDGPYSFSGRLITLKWAIEVVADARGERWEFALGPDKREVLLRAVTTPALSSAPRKWYAGVR